MTPDCATTQVGTTDHTQTPDDMTSDMQQRTPNNRLARDGVALGGRIVAAIGLLTFALMSTGCVEVGLPADGNQTHGTFVPIFGMHDTISYKDQESQRFVPQLPDPKPAAASGMRYPPAETVARDSLSAATWSAKRVQAMDNPVPVDENSLAHGQTAYNTTCISCHGKMGKGNGPVADAWTGPNIPSLLTETARNYSDGQLYQIITHGQGTMWSYKSQLRPMERWAVVNWIRVLQRAHHPEPWDDTPGPTTAQVN